MKIKSLIILVIVNFSFSSLASQNKLFKAVIGCTGKQAVRGNSALKFTMGEPFISYTAHSAKMLSQGFQQPTAPHAFQKSKKIKPEFFTIYPNPSSSKLNLITNTEGQITSNYKISIFDLNGIYLIKDANYINNQTIDLSTFHSGNYIIKLYNQTKMTYSTKIIQIIK